MRRRELRETVATIAAVTAATGLLLAGCTTPGGHEVSVVEITGAGFSPVTLEVAAGTEVRWTNATPQAHTVTSGGPLLPDQQPVPDGAEELDSGRLLEGETFAQVLDVEGDYYYWCSYHGDEQQMVGTVRVVAP